ncbi:alpha/beta fold hydrolase [Streptomyces sp. NPDC000349]|uniref:alpha/beta fold hydrolase n=1 Tax=unclassified Streptomyces TaxID=2593676 RepID=UPI00277FAE21|nr:alpha/beta fold hydrolase [Streptomyces sp. DSM 40167]MDQ0405552.1 pimeloyl-ACP methyl ester carboxylesterase [Streptomyces sp. DSM 40167]
MFRTLAKATAAIAVVCTVAGAGLVLDEEYANATTDTETSSTGAIFTGTKQLRVDGHTVNVSCSGNADGADQPLVMLMAGGGEGLENMAPLQKAVSRTNRVCSYDRLGEGASDKPAPGTPQTMDDTGRLLTKVLDRLAGNRPVVLAGHSLGGYIAARYTPHHTDRVKGLVLLDATIPHLTRDMNRTIPADATGIPAQVRAGALAANEGQNPEQFVIADGRVRSAGRIPVEILKHESQYAEVPQYGPALERMWAKGQHEWRALSTRSHLTTAKGAGHYIHTDRPDLALKAVKKVTRRAAHQR